MVTKALPGNKNHRKSKIKYQSNTFKIGMVLIATCVDRCVGDALTRYDASKGMESLENVWVSVANARQRKGRAGRVAPGASFHLFTSNRYDHQLRQHPVPGQCDRSTILFQVSPRLVRKVNHPVPSTIDPPSCPRSVR